MNGAVEECIQAKEVIIRTGKGPAYLLNNGYCELFESDQKERLKRSGWVFYTIEDGQDLTGRVFALWRLAFKPESDDMREAPSIVIVHELTKRGAKCRAFDPKATETAKRVFEGNDGISFESSEYTALSNTDALILVTEWKEFQSPDFDEMKSRMKEPVIFDGRNQYNAQMLQTAGFTYYQIGC